jgi:hypothetical protein
MPGRKHNIPQKKDSDAIHRTRNMFGALSLLSSDDEDNSDSENNVKSNISPTPVKEHILINNSRNNKEYKKYEKPGKPEKYEKPRKPEKYEKNEKTRKPEKYEKYEKPRTPEKYEKYEKYDKPGNSEDTKNHTEPDEDPANMYIAPSGGNDEWNYVSKKYKKSRNKYENDNYEKTNKALFDESAVGPCQLENMGDNIYFNSKWNVSLHNIEKEDWSLDSYEHIYSFNNFGRYLRLFNNFHLLDKINNDIFIMRDGVTPIWEDLNNRYGGICSLKIDYYNKIGRNEIGSEIMFCITTLIINESLIRNNQDINGISYSIRNKSIFIKIWVKDYKKDSAFPSRMPLEFLDKVNTVLQNSDTNRRTLHSRSKISVQYKEIVPEYSM